MRIRDLILIASVLVVALIALLVVELQKQPGAEVIVCVDGAEIARYSLAEPGTYALNGGTNQLCIENGAARMVDASCPDRLCVHQGSVSKTGQVITCLPYKLTVTVRGADEGVDLVG